MACITELPWGRESQPFSFWKGTGGHLKQRDLSRKPGLCLPAMAVPRGRTWGSELTPAADLVPTGETVMS